MQDAWKVTPALTLNYGFRWEGAFNPTPEANNDFLLSRVQNFVSPVEGRRIDATQIPDQTGQWGPRFGFAWDPNKDGRTVVRKQGDGAAAGEVRERRCGGLIRLVSRDLQHAGRRASAHELDYARGCVNRIGLGMEAPKLEQMFGRHR